MKKKPRITSAILLKENNKYLLGKRNKENYNGYWVIPGGGLRFGEAILDAGIREFKEETNLEVLVDKFIGYKEIINIPGDYHSVVFYHLASLKSGEIKAMEDIDELKFFTVDEIKKIKHAESVAWVLKELGKW